MGSLSGELHEALLRNVRAKAMQAARKGQVVVVAGTMEHTMPEGVRNHSYIRYFYGDNGLGRFSVPSNAGLVIHSKYVRHHDVDRLKEEAYKKGIEFSPYPFTTGDLREILAPLASVVPLPPALSDAAKPTHLVDHGVIVAAQSPAVPAEFPKETDVQIQTASSGRMVRPGLLKKFVIANANLRTENLEQEAKRLLAIAKTDPELAMTTKDSLTQSMRALRKERGIIVSTMRPVARPVATSKTVAPVIHKTNGHGALGNEDVVIGIIRDAKAALDLALEEYQKAIKRAQQSEKALSAIEQVLGKT